MRHMALKPENALKPWSIQCKWGVRKCKLLKGDLRENQLNVLTINTESKAVLMGHLLNDIVIIVKYKCTSNQLKYHKQSAVLKLV